ncbi:MAG: hypothetical protein V3V00_02905 [Saprospiraceae bacterium]
MLISIAFFLQITNFIINKLLLIALLFVLPETTFSQMPGLDLLGNRSYIEIPFRIEQGFIILEARFHNSVNLDFIFDTGAENTLIFEREIPEIFGIPYDRRIEIMGSDFSTGLFANIIRKVIFSLGKANIVLRDVVVLEENILLLEERLGINVDGIIGGSFFRNLVVEINYSKKKLVLYHPEKVNPRIYSKYTPFDIEIRHGKPYLRAKTAITPGTERELIYLIDSGASLPFLIHTNTDTLLQLPQGAKLGSLGFGITGILKGYIGQIYNLEIGPFSFPNLVTSFQDIEYGKIDSGGMYDGALTRNGIIGNHLMRRFNIIINYFDNTAYFRPRRKKKYSKSFDYDRSGLLIFAVGIDLNEFLVKDVTIDSPSHDVDIRPGDIIIKIGRRKTKFMNLESVNNRLQGRVGKKIKIEIEREGEKIKKTIILRDWFLSNKKNKKNN